MCASGRAADATYGDPPASRLACCHALRPDQRTAAAGVTGSVTIVGGGVAGLTLAAALDPARFDVRLLEAQPERHALGAALGVWPAARRVLDRLGVWAALEPQAARQRHVALHTLAGRRLLSGPAPDLWLVDRGALMAALADAVPASVRQNVAEVVDPAALPGDLVVGADGVRSRVRALVDPARAQRHETPYVALRGILPADEVDRFGEFWGRGRLFGTVPMHGGRVYWFAAWHHPGLAEPLDVGLLLAQARTAFTGAAPAITGLLDRAGEQTLATRLWTAPPMRRYARGRYVVVGDAAHASLPNLGRGACDAILDAARLAAALDRGGSLAAWQARRLPVTQAARVGAGGLMRLATLGTAAPPD